MCHPFTRMSSSSVYFALDIALVLAVRKGTQLHMGWLPPPSFITAMMSSQFICHGKLGVSSEVEKHGLK